MRSHLQRLIVGVLAAGLAAGGTAPRVGASGLTASDVIRRAVVERLGPGVDVDVTSVGAVGHAAFRAARPDPSARLGKPMRFILVTDDGASIPVTVSLTVVGAYAMTARAIERGEKLAVEDIRAVRAEVAEGPLRRLPSPADLVGARALRAIPAGTMFVTGMVTAARAVEPGDRVTVVASAGAVEVTATFVAADGGDPGAVIRVVNPETKRYLRGRITTRGWVEVLNGR